MWSVMRLDGFGVSWRDGVFIVYFGTRTVTNDNTMLSPPPLRNRCGGKKNLKKTFLLQKKKKKTVYRANRGKPIETSTVPVLANMKRVHIRMMCGNNSLTSEIAVAYTACVAH